MKNKNSIVNYLLVLLGVLVLVNILANRFFLRLDLTEDQRYTLSAATLNILSELDEPITVRAFFSKDVPPQIASTRTDFRDLLVEYGSRSGGNVVYEFVDPGKDEAIEVDAQKEGIQPILISLREKDKSVQKRAYMGAVVSLGEASEVIPVVQPGASMEYALTTAIKKLTVVEKPVIGFIQGHGEATIGSMMQVMEGLNILYDVEPVNLTDSTILSKYRTIALINPSDSIPDNHLSLLDQYLADGGNLFIAFNRVDGDFSNAMGLEVNTGLERWMKEKGLEVQSQMIIDASCGAVTVPQNISGFGTFNTQVQFPYVPIITNFGDHPITEGLETVMLTFASPIEFIGDIAKLKFVPLALTSEQSGFESVPCYFDIQRNWTAIDFPRQYDVVAALLEGEISGNNNARLVVVTDGDFPINGEGQQAHQIQPDNANLMVNSIDWLSDDTGLISLRTKGVTSRMLDQIEDGTKSTLKWLNFLLPILLVIIYGFMRYQKNRMLRMKRKEVDYVW